jgi:hypothetical protein
MASIVGNDPLARFLRDHAADKHPIPLIATRIDVTIRGGLACVTTERTFRNSEQQSIEATMTFPVPVDATLCSLTARIDGRTLNAVAKARAQARETYEDAVDRGKAAALHEELLKGIHMLSVAHVKPGAEIVVTDIWTVPLAFVGGEPRLRIPTTVGEIYGCSPLSADDDLVTSSSQVHEATIAIQCDNGTATLLCAGRASGSHHTVTLDAPIDIVLAGWKAKQLVGVAADGRRVTLDIEPAPTVDASLDIDLLFDHSGSMAEQVVGEREIRGSKFDVAKSGLATVARDRIKASDKLRLWEFNDSVRFVGEAAGDWRALVAALNPPDGGTEIGRAFDAAIATGKAKNVVIVTDGKSWAFAPHTLARAGIRVTAVLIGEDALEAGIAHLAGMTGGQTFIAVGSNADAAISDAIEAARAPCVQPEPIEGTLSHVVALRRGARIVAAWSEPGAEAATAETRLVGATAAMLAIPLMREEAAAELAEREGIVCHLTSLVLVDEAGEQHAGVPAVRKVALTASRTSSAAVLGSPMRASYADVAQACAMPRALAPEEDSRAGRLFQHERSKAAFDDARRRSAPSSDDIRPGAPPPRRTVPLISLRGIAGRIDWDDDPQALRRGHLAALTPVVEGAIRTAAQGPDVIALAQALGLDPIVVVIALLARSLGAANRSAQRLARSILGKRPGAEIEAALTEVGLS